MPVNKSLYSLFEKTRSFLSGPDSLHSRAIQSSLECVDLPPEARGAENVTVTQTLPEIIGHGTAGICYDIQTLARIAEKCIDFDRSPGRSVCILAAATRDSFHPELRTLKFHDDLIATQLQSAR